MAVPAGSYITLDDLRALLNPQTVAACYDDAGDGKVNDAAVLFVIRSAEAQVNSYVARVYRGTWPPPGPAPELVKLAAAEFAVAYTLQRHPEYVRTFGEDRRVARLKEAQALCERIADGMQYLNDHTAQPVPANAGGIVADGAPRFMVDYPDGTTTRGDF